MKKKRRVDWMRILDINAVILKMVVLGMIIVTSYLLYQDDFLSVIHFASINDVHSSYLFYTMNQGIDLLFLSGLIVCVLFIVVFIIKKIRRHQHLIDSIYVFAFVLCWLFLMVYMCIGGNEKSAQMCIVLSSMMFLQKLPYTLIFYVPYVFSLIKDIHVMKIE